MQLNLPMPEERKKIFIVSTSAFESVVRNVAVDVWYYDPTNDPPLPPLSCPRQPINSAVRKLKESSKNTRNINFYHYSMLRNKKLEFLPPPPLLEKRICASLRYLPKIPKYLREKFEEK